MKSISGKIEELLETQNIEQLVAELAQLTYQVSHIHTQHIEKQWITCKMICLFRLKEDDIYSLIDKYKEGTLVLYDSEKTAQEVYDAVWCYGDYDGDMWVESDNEEQLRREHRFPKDYVKQYTGRKHIPSSRCIQYRYDGTPKKRNNY